MTGAAVARLSRRAALKGAVAAASLIGAPMVRRASASDRSLKIAAFGGCFESNLKRHLYPEFERATGIRVEPVASQGVTEFLIHAGRSAAASPVDLCMADQEEVARGMNAGIWRIFDVGRIANLHLLDRCFVQEDGAGVGAIGGMAWYQTLVVNPKTVSLLPKSWKALWAPGHAGAWGLASGGRSTLFEITAATWFGGNAILETPDGVRQVVAKIEELKENVRLWWESEGTMQTAYEDGQVAGGMYFHDVAGLMARSGTDIVSIFPEEGGVLDFASWCQPASSTKTEEAEEFINFMCSPAAQAIVTRVVGTAPLIDRSLMDLSDAEFTAAASDRPPIKIAVQARTRLLGLMDRQFAEMVTS
jgi:putative spermidine/putrescine transport system substrate-binding protein